MIKSDNEKGELIAPNKNETYKTIKLQESRDNLGVKELDIIDIALSQLTYGDKKKNKLIVEMCVDDYKDLYLNSNNIYRDFKKSCKKLQGSGIFVEDKKNNKEKWYSLFSTIEYLNSQAKVIITFTEEIKEVLFEDDIKIIWHGLKYSIRLNNRYSKKRYYHVKGFCYGRYIREEFADDLMKKLEVPRSYYENFRKFEKYVLKRSDEDINLLTDLVIRTEVDKTKKPYKITTHIRKKTTDEMELTEKHFNGLKIQAPIISDENEESLYEKIEKRLKLYNDINITAKKAIAEELDITIKTLNMYIYIINDLIIELKEMFLKGFLSVLNTYKYSKMDKEEQLEIYKKILKEIDKLKKKLCKELSEKLEKFEITFLQAKKYSTYDSIKQLELYNTRFAKDKKKNKKAIDVEYTEVSKTDNEKSIDINNSRNMEVEKGNNIGAENNIATEELNETNNAINQIKEILKEFNLNDEQAKKIYDNSNKDIEYIEYIYGQLKKQRNNIENKLGWIMKMVKPNNYNAPVRQEVVEPPKLRFNNFEGRKYDHDDLEKKLLGWDEDDDEIDEFEVVQEVKEEKVNNHSEDKDDILSKLERLKILRSENVISEEEFIVLKNDIFSKISKI